MPNHTSTDPALRSVQSPHTHAHTCSVVLHTARATAGLRVIWWCSCVSHTSPLAHTLSFWSHQEHQTGHERIKQLSEFSICSICPEFISYVSHFCLCSLPVYITGESFKSLTSPWCSPPLSTRMLKLTPFRSEMFFTRFELNCIKNYFKGANILFAGKSCVHNYQPNHTVSFFLDAHAMPRLRIWRRIHKTFSRKFFLTAIFFLKL